MSKTDPWKHRSKGMVCETCIWFVAKGSSTLGRCRKHAPSSKGFVPVFLTDWCGDHRLDENAVDQQGQPAAGDK